MSFEKLSAEPGAPIPMGINGAPGRMATQALLQAVNGNFFIPIMGNTHKGSLCERWARGLEVDDLYGPTGVTDVRPVSFSDLDIVMGRRREAVGDAIAFTTPNGDQVSVLGSAEPNPDLIHWDILGNGYDGRGSYDGKNRDEVAAAIKYLTVFDGSRLKLEVGGDGKIRAPKGRHPGLHLDSGARLVLAMSPLDIDNGLYLPKHRAVTVMDYKQSKLETLLGEGVRVFSPSSCSTNGIMVFLMAVREGGFEVKELNAHISHSNTESDSALKGSHVRRSRSGSQNEVVRLLPDIGMSIDPYNIDITAQRMNVDVGSLIHVRLKIAGGLPQDFIGSLKQGVVESGMVEDVGFSKYPVTSATIRNDGHVVMIDEDVAVRSDGESSIINIELGFQNEIGYTKRALRLAYLLANILKGMDAAGETSK